MSVRARLLRWYAREGRDLPWRRTRDPYRILVSEVMLQQTQVARVRQAYVHFLRRFTTLRALARASLGDVLRAWAGLGYNRRARDLHRLARAVVAEGGALPSGVDALDALPGIGHYTAAAVACFAHGRALPLADTNVRRVLGRVYLGRVATEREAVRLDSAQLPARGADRWHHALMDLGATVCTSRAPRCAGCPLRPVCVSADRVPPPVPRRRQGSFAASDRRLRGRILGALRPARAGLSPVYLRRRLADARVPRLLAALSAEGLIERDGRRVRLPG